jgi:hypothetical protein
LSIRDAPALLFFFAFNLLAPNLIEAAF